MRSAKITVDCWSLREPTAATIDQIARLKLAARRCNCELEVEDPSPALLELMSLVGLAGVLLVQAKGKTEQREQSRGVEEENVQAAALSWSVRVGTALGVVFIMTIKPDLVPSLIAVIAGALLGGTVGSAAISRLRPA